MPKSKEMEEEMKENSQDKNFMYKLAEFIVDKRNLFFLIYIIALVFCIFWQIALITGTFFLSMRVNKIFCGWRKRIVMIPMFAAAAFLFLFLAWNWLLYSFQFEIGRAHV